MGRLLETLPKDKPLYSLNVGEFEQLMCELINANNVPHIEIIKPDDKQENYSISELATKLRVSQSTIHRYKNNGVIPFYKADRTVYFKISEVEQALSSSPKKKGNKV